MRSRAERRGHYQRMKRKVLRLIWWVETETHAAKFANNRKPCSCWMCGHQRKHHGVPFGEQRRIASASWDD